MIFYYHVLIISIVCLFVSLVMLVITEHDAFFISAIYCVISIYTCFAFLSDSGFSIELLWDGFVFKRDYLPSGLTKHIVQSCRCCCGCSR